MPLCHAGALGLSSTRVWVNTHAVPVQVTLTSLDGDITRGPPEADPGSGPLGQGVLGKCMFGIQSRKEACGPGVHGPRPFASLPREVVAVECGC